MMLIDAMTSNTVAVMMHISVREPKSRDGSAIANNSMTVHSSIIRTGIPFSIFGRLFAFRERKIEYSVMPIVAASAKMERIMMMSAMMLSMSL